MSILKSASIHSTYYGINSVLFRECLLWNRLPLSLKQAHPRLEFKSAIIYKIFETNYSFQVKKRTTEKV